MITGLALFDSFCSRTRPWGSTVTTTLVAVRPTGRTRISRARKDLFGASDGTGTRAGTNGTGATTSTDVRGDSTAPTFATTTEPTILLPRRMKL